MHLLDLTAITVAGLLVGNEFAIAAFIHPTLASLPADAHLRSASALARTLGRHMPFWYALTALLGIAEALTSWHRTGHWPPLLTIAAALWLLTILLTVLALVPINNRIADGTHSAAVETNAAGIETKPTAADTNRILAADTAGIALWIALRHRWDSLHRWRVLLLLTAYLLLLEGVTNAAKLPGS